LITWLLTTFNFFASGLGILTLGAVAVVMLLFWDWRLFLSGLWVIQLGVAVLVSRVYGINQEWVQVQILVNTICVAMLCLSAYQIRFALPYQQPGSWLVRTMAITLLLLCWRLFDFELTLPMLAPPLAQLFLWLAVCALIMLGLGDAPLSTGTALLLWFIPVQAFIQILLPEFRLFVLIGMIQILSALASSYLMLTARLPVVATASMPTDIAFPATLPFPLSLPAPATARPAPPVRQFPPSGQPPSAQPLRPENARGEPPVAPRNAS